MTEFELWTAILAAAALGISALSYVVSRRAERLAKEANVIANKRLSEHVGLNTPFLVFKLKTLHPEPRRFITVIITTVNSGGHPTEIIEGAITLHSYKYPEADKSYKLTGIKIGGRDEYVTQFDIQAPMIDGQGTGISPTEIICKALYTRPNQDNDEVEDKYIYDAGKRDFIHA